MATVNTDLIHLNVGGSLYTTTRATLCSYPESMLGAMFGGRMDTGTDDQGRYFIDRNGRSFAHVLDFLRSSRLVLPSDPVEVEQLAIEADFYQIEPLIAAIREKTGRPQRGNHLALEIFEFIKDVSDVYSTTFVVAKGKVVDMILPSGLIDHKSGLEAEEVFQMRLRETNGRFRLGEFLSANGWERISSDFSSSSAFVASKFSKVVIEHSHVERWILADQSL